MVVEYYMHGNGRVYMFSEKEKKDLDLLVEIGEKQSGKIKFYACEQLLGRIII